MRRSTSCASTACVCSRPAPSGLPDACRYQSGWWAGRTQLHPILEAGERDFPQLAGQLAALNPEEPYRRALTFVRERIRAAARRAPGGYREPGELLDDLRRVRDGLESGPGVLTAGGDLHDVIRQVEVFGFHFARLDIRENAKVHRRSLAEIFATLGVCSDYEGAGRRDADRDPATPHRRPPAADPGRYRGVLGQHPGGDRDLSSAPGHAR